MGPFHENSVGWNTVGTNVITYYYKFLMFLIDEGDLQ